MNQSKVRQENYCLEAKMLCDALRTKLFLLEDFDDYEFYAKQLKKLKKQVDEIYWSL